MYLEEPDVELRNAIISYYWAKGNYVTEFLVDFKIESVAVHYIKHNDIFHKVISIKPKFSEKKTKKSIVIGGSFYNRSFDIGSINAIVNHHKDLEKQLFNDYNEPYPGAWSNDNPWSRKKQKPNKRR